MAKTDWTLNDVVRPQDLNALGEEINGMAGRSGGPVLSPIPPENPEVNGFWFQDLGDSMDLGGETTLVLGNGSQAPDMDIWFEDV